jgi:hypothetical protein
MDCLIPTVMGFISGVDLPLPVLSRFDGEWICVKYPLLAEKPCAGLSYAGMMLMFLWNFDGSWNP